MSLDDTWAENLGDVEISYLYRTMNRLIEDNHRGLETKGEQDIAWAIKFEYERRLKAQGGKTDVPGGVFL